MFSLFPTVRMRIWWAQLIFTPFAPAIPVPCLQESEHSDSNISIKVEVNTENQGEEKPDMVAEMMEKDRRDSEYSSH